MSNGKVNPVELTKSGDCKAIDFLINQQLNSQGITARSASHNGCLQIILESETVPIKEKLVPFICKGIRGLEIDFFQSSKCLKKLGIVMRLRGSKKLVLEAKNLSNFNLNRKTTPRILLIILEKIMTSLLSLKV